MTTQTADKTPHAARAALLNGQAMPDLPSPLDYKDADQIASRVLIDGEPWVLLLRRGQ